MDLGLQNRVAAVLGSTAGLGCAAASALHAEGARVAICGRREEQLQEALKNISAQDGGEVWGQSLDVTDRGRLEGFLKDVKDRWGRLDILVTNAGGPPRGRAAELSSEDFEKGMRLTLQSAVWAIQTVLPWMRDQGWGRIIGMTSIAVRQPIPDLPLSNVTRSALTAYFKSLAYEVGEDRILVNTICTGSFATDRLEDLFTARAKKNQTTADAVPKPGVQERASDKAVAAADKLDDDNLLAAVLDSQAYRIAQNKHGTEHQHATHRQYDTSADVHQSLQAL